MNILVILFSILVVLSGNVYVDWHVYRIIPLPVSLKVVIVVLMVLSFLSLLVSVSRYIDSLPHFLATAIYEVGTSWIFILLYLSMSFLLLDLGRLVHVVPKSFLFDSWCGTGVVLAVMLSVFIYGNMHYKNKIRRSLSFTTTKVAAPVKIVVMSDLHIGYHNTRVDLSEWIDKINAENPDFVILVGDVIDRSVVPIDRQNMAEEFHRIKAPVYACLGNHEYYSGCREAVDFYSRAGINLLRDSAATFGNIAIIGRDDRTNSFYCCPIKVFD